jgi:hypothetical protein
VVAKWDAIVFRNSYGSWELSLPFVQTKKSMSDYIGLMELLCVVMHFSADYSQSKHVAP